jgi:hydroxyacylglutathione hydrolase
MIITLPIGLMGSNCIIIYDEKTKIGAIVDPGILSADPLFKVISQHNIEVAYILNTHGHFDHTAGNHLMPPTAKLAILPADLTLLLTGGGAAMFGLSSEPSPHPQIELQHLTVIQLGETDVQVMHTPGHTPGCVSFYVKLDQTILTGDTLFQGSVGRTDLPGGNEATLLKSLETYLTLPDSTVVLPGHGDASTIQEEKLYNPWLRYIMQR